MAGNLQVQQTSARGIIDWRTFSIGTGGAVSILNGQGATLNRVTGGQMSVIRGTLSATGSVYLVNPQGVVVGSEGRILAGGAIGLLTRDISNTDFLAGGPFTARGQTDAGVVNLGRIISRDGDVFLVGASVLNDGEISAGSGLAGLAAADTVVIAPGEGIRGLYVAAGSGGSGDVTVSGRIDAAAAALQSAGGDVYVLAGNRAGSVQATGVSQSGGQVWLSAPEGEVRVDGGVRATKGDAGGDITLSGRGVTVGGSAVLDATGNSGGTVLVGVTAPAMGLSDVTTIASGARILAGGPTGGGMVETSGHLMIIGDAVIRAGEGGLWLVDPVDLTIDAPAASTIASALNAGTSVIQQTTATGAVGVGSQAIGSGDIIVAAPINWTGSGSLTLDAYQDVLVNAAINGTGTGGLTLLAGRSISSGAAIAASTLNLTATTGGIGTTAAGTLTGPNGITLTAAQAISLGGTVSNLTGGQLLVTGSTGVTLSGAVNARAVTVNANGGTLATGASATITGTNGVTLFGSQGVTLGAAVTNTQAGSGSLSIVSGGAISAPVALVGRAVNLQANGGSLTATSVNSSTAGAVNITALGSVSLSSTLTAQGALTVTGGQGVALDAVTGSSTVNLTANGGALTTSGAVSGVGGTSYRATGSATLGSSVANTGSGALSVRAGGGVTVSGAASGPTVSMSANGGNLTIGATGSVSGTNGVTLGTTGNFINNRGANGVQTSTGRWLVYSTNPTTDTLGGLAFDFIQYGATYPVDGVGATVPAQGSGNGRLYSLAPTLSFDLTGSVAKTYDGTTTTTLSPANILATGLIGSDTLSLTAAYTTADAGTQIGVTASGATVTNAGKPVYGYILPTPSVTADIGTINRKTLTAAIIGNPTRIYNRSTYASVSSGNFLLTGFVAGQGATVVSTTGATYDSDQAGARTVTAGLAPSSFSATGGTLLSNYDLPTSATGAGTINKATVRVSGILAGNKTYDGTASASLDISQALLFGQVAGDAVALDLSTAGGNYASANVGAGQVITASGFTLSGASAANYDLVQPQGLSGNITARGISILGLSAQNKVYDGNTTATLNLAGLTLSGLVATDVGQVTLTTGGASGTFESANADLGLRVTASGFGLSGAKAGNYSVSAPTLFANITQRQLTAAISGNPTKVYNATSTANVDTSAYSLSGFVAGQGATLTPKATAYYDSPNAGARTVSANIATPDITADAGTRLTNYILPTTATGVGTITKAAVTFNIVGNPTKVYDANTVATLSPANFQAVGLMGADSLTVTQTTGTYASANAGAWLVTADLTGKIAGAASLFNNYTFATSAAGTGSITRAPLTEGVGPIFNLNGQLVGNPTKVYDGTDAITGLTTANFVLTGLQGTDTIQVVKTTGVFENVNAGVQRIRVDLNSNSLTTTDYVAGAGTLLSNYVLLSEIFGNGSITPKPISASLTGDPTKTYNGSNVAVLTSANYVFTGLVGADSIVVGQAAQAFYDSANAGARGVTVTLREADLQGAGATRLSNYIIPGTVTGSGTILQAPLRLYDYVANSKTYDGTNVASLDFSQATLFGAVTGDAVSLNTGAATGTFATSNAGGGIGVTISGLSLSGAGAANYTLVPLTGVTANINARGLSVSGVFANSRTYNATTVATLNAVGATLNGVLAGDVGQVNLTQAGVGGTFSSPYVRNGIPVTAYGFGLSGAKSSNYALSQPGGLSANITPAPLSAMVTATPTKTYDGSTSVSVPFAGISVSGFFGTDGATLGQYAASTFNSPDAGASVGLTVTLRVPDFIATGSTDLSNYQFPTTALGTGVINRATLTAQVIGRPTKVYDGNAVATVSAANFRINGFVSGQGAAVNATSGTYSSANAGDRPVTVNFAGAPDFTADAGTNLANYNLPTTATGAGTISAKSLAVSIIGNPTKTYDSTTTASLTSANYSVTGMIGTDAFTVTETTGTYDLSDAGNRTVTALLSASDFTAAGSTLAGNYVFPASASGVGQINVKLLTLIRVQRVYNSQTSVAGSAYTLSGVETSDLASVSVVEALVTGAFDTKSVGTNKLVNLAGVALAGARSANYSIAPTVTNGAIGVITPATLSFSGPAAVSRVYDATRVAQIDNTAPIVWTGLFAGDLVNLGTIPTTGLFDTKNVGVNKPVTVSGYSIAGADAGNYSLAQPSGLTATITPLAGALAITSAVKTYDGSTALPSGSAAYTLSGVLAGDTVTVASATGSGFASKNVATGLDVSISTVTLGGVDGGNYVAPTGPASPNTIGTINPRSLLATVTGNPTKTYDGTTTATLTSADYSVSGWVSGEGATVTKTTGTYNSPNAGYPYTGRSVTVSLAASDYSATGTTLLSNYTLPTSASGGGTINRATLTVSGVTSSDKIYDGNAVAAVNAGGSALVGVVAADVGQVSLTTSAATGTFASPNAGTWTVTFAGFGLSGTQASNYTLTQPASVTQTIATKLVSVASVTKVYNRSVAATQASGASYTLTGVLAGDVGQVALNSAAVTGVYRPGDPAGWDVGTGLQVNLANLGLSGASAGNYAINSTQVSNIGVITQAPIYVSGMTVNTRAYNGTTAATLNTAGATFTGQFAGDNFGIAYPTTGTFASKDAGTRAVTPGTPMFIVPGGVTGYENYYIVNQTGMTGVITPAPLSVSITGNPTKVYDATDAATLAAGNYNLSGLVGSETFTVNQTAGTYSSADAGSRTVTASLAAGDFTGANGGLITNYSFPATATGSGTITPRPVSASISGASRAYDGTFIATLIPANFSLTGFVAGQGATVTQTSGIYSSADVGSWGISTTLAPGQFTANAGTNLANYFLPISATGSGAITPKALSVSITGNPTKTYDGATLANLSSASYSLTGFVSGQGATISKTTGSYDSANAGARTVTTSLAAGDFTVAGGTSLSNYTLPVTASGAGTIAQKALTVAITGTPTKTYDGTATATLAASNYSLTGLVGTEGFTVNQTAGTYDSANAGARTVSANLGVGNFTGTGGGLISNYSFAPTATGVGAISQKTLTALVTGNPTKTYDGSTTATLASGNYSLSGFVGGDGATVNKTAGTYDSANAGARTVSAALASGDFLATGTTNLSNYVLPVSASGVGTISQKALTVAITGNPTKTYDGATSATLTSANYSLSGLVASETFTVNQTVGTYDSANAGTRTVSATLAAGNFIGASGGLISNYSFTTPVTGTGAITQKALSVAIIGSPTKTYDGATSATLTSANYSLTGLVGSETFTVNQTAGTYDSANAGARTVSATLAAGNFIGASGGLISNYSFATPATGTGAISQKALSVAITGNPTKAYDGTTAATLTPANYSLSGLVGSETFTVNQTAGTYDSANAGARTVTATLAPGNFTGASGGQISNYSFATPATGAGAISQKALTVAITGNPTKVYDGTTAATLAPANYSLSGLVGSETFTVTQAVGTYDSADAGARTVSTSLAAGNFVGAGGGQISNYSFAPTATGVGTISQQALVIIGAIVIGNPTKTYDGNSTATLTSGNFKLSGFVGSDGATVTKTTGTYDSVTAGARTVTTSLAAGDFLANEGTNLSNYALPTSATGVGTIDPRVLTAAIIGTPTRAYDGTAAAVLTSANFGLTGFATGEGATVTRTAGTYNGVDAGSRSVSTNLAGSDFSAGAGTNLANYVLPGSASGLGRIDARTLTLSLSGDYSKTYDGNRTGAVAPGAVTVTGFAAGEGGSVSAASGSYDSADAGARIFSVLVAQSDYVLTGGAKASNYVLPTSAGLAATISRRVLSADITGSPTRTYDGTNLATLSAADFRLTGFVAGQGASVTQTRGTYASADAGQRAVIAGLGAGDFTAQGDTRLSNYILPTTAAGAGQISPAVLTASIVGNPTKAYDGNTSATLNTGNFALSGLVSGQSISVSQTVGAYDAETPGPRTVTAGLLGGNFIPAVGVSLSNYVLPTLATGAGTISESTSGDPVKDILVGLGVPEDEANATSRQAAFAGGTPRVYIPFPAPGSLSTLRSNGLAILPGILEGQSGQTASGLQSGLSTVESGAPVINGSDSILLQGSRSKRWTIFVPMASGPSDQDAGDR
jgi:filamentous hemagglutinin family protein